MILFLSIIVIGLLIGFFIDKIKVGGDGIWHGHGEPPEGFVGFWDRGDTVVQWPIPSDKIEAHRVTVDEIIGGFVDMDSIVGGTVTADKIVSNSIDVQDIIPDPDRPGFLTTKKELAARREDNGNL